MVVFVEGGSWVMSGRAQQQKQHCHLRYEYCSSDKDVEEEEFFHTTTHYLGPEGGSGRKGVKVQQVPERLVGSCPVLQREDMEDMEDLTLKAMPTPTTAPLSLSADQLNAAPEMGLSDVRAPVRLFLHKTMSV